MKIGIDPSIDFAFKKLFGSEENKYLLIDLVNAILIESGEKKVVELQLLNPYNLKAFQKDKMSILDIKAQDESNEWFIIEMQIIMSDHFPKRVLYYWARNYQDQLKEKEQYDLLKKVTLISISKESLPIQTQSYWNLWRLSSVKEKEKIFCRDLAIYSIELSKFKNTSDTMTSLQRWAYFLKNGEDLDDEALPQALETPIMQQAVNELKKFSMSEIERAIYESRRMAIMDEKTRMAERYEKGKRDGVIDTARNMIRKNMETSLIMELTGLDQETVETMRKGEL